MTHDCGDIFLELAKMLHYAKLDTLCDIMFGLFLCIWTATRLGVFPTWIFYRFKFFKKEKKVNNASVF